MSKGVKKGITKPFYTFKKGITKQVDIHLATPFVKVYL